MGGGNFTTRYKQKEIQYWQLRRNDEKYTVPELLTGLKPVCEFLSF